MSERTPLQSTYIHTYLGIIALLWVVSRPCNGLNLRSVNPHDREIFDTRGVHESSHQMLLLGFEEILNHKATEYFQIIITLVGIRAFKIKTYGMFLKYFELFYYEEKDKFTFIFDSLYPSLQSNQVF